MSDPFLQAAIDEALAGEREGGIPYGIPHVIVGENQTFLGEEDLLRSRGVTIDIRQNGTCVEMMARFITSHPELWHEDIGL